MRIDTKLYTCSKMKVYHLSEIATSRAHRIDASACGLSNALTISKSEPYIALTCLTCPPIQASNSKPVKRGRQTKIGIGWHCIWWHDVRQGQHHAAKMSSQSSRSCMHANIAVVVFDCVNNNRIARSLPHPALCGAAHPTSTQSKDTSPDSQ